MGAAGGYSRSRWASGLAVLAIVAVAGVYAAILTQSALHERAEESLQGPQSHYPRVERRILERIIMLERAAKPARPIKIINRTPAQTAEHKAGETAPAEAAAGHEQQLASADPAQDKPAEASPDSAYADIERAIARQTKPAVAVIEVDREMQMGRDYTASLVVEGGDGSNIETITVSTPEPAATELQIETASSAAAYAASSAFRIQPLSPAAQSIRTGAPTIWRWQLTPKQAGEADLMFILMQSILVNGEIRSYPVRQFPQNIRVSLSWWLWARELALSSWGALTAVLVAAASVATILHSWHEVIKARRETPSTPAPQPPTPPAAPPSSRKATGARAQPKPDAVERIRADAHRRAGIKEQ